MGVGDAESGTAGGVKREISSSLTRGINGKRLCGRLKKKDAQAGRPFLRASRAALAPPALPSCARA